MFSHHGVETSFPTNSIVFRQKEEVATCAPSAFLSKLIFYQSLAHSTMCQGEKLEDLVSFVLKEEIALCFVW